MSESSFRGQTKHQRSARIFENDSINKRTRLTVLGNQVTAAELVTNFARLLSSTVRSEKDSKRRFKSRRVYSFIDKECQLFIPKLCQGVLKCVPSTVRLKIKSKFIIRGVNFHLSFPCFRDFHFFQVYRQSLPGNRAKTTLKAITTFL